jgi:hypothetical protein
MIWTCHKRVRELNVRLEWQLGNWVVVILIDSCRCCQIRWKLGIGLLIFWLIVADVVAKLDGNYVLCCWYFDLTSAEKIVQHCINSQFISHKFPRTLKSWKLTLWRWDFMGTYFLAYYWSFICVPLCLSTK